MSKKRGFLQVFELQMWPRMRLRKMISHPNAVASKERMGSWLSKHSLTNLPKFFSLSGLVHHDVWTKIASLSTTTRKRAQILNPRKCVNVKEMKTDKVALNSLWIKGLPLPTDVFVYPSLGNKDSAPFDSRSFNPRRLQLNAHGDRNLRLWDHSGPKQSKRPPWLTELV